MNQKLKIGIGAAGFVLFAVLLTVSILLPRDLQGDVLRLRLLSKAHSDTGSLATFELHNENGPKVDVWSAVMYQPDGQRDIAIAPITLEKGDKAKIPIEVPSEGKWQVGFLVNKHPRQRSARGTIVFSEWIDSTQTPK